MSLSTKTNTHILCVLHTNPGSDKARGHLGSSLQRKAKGEQLHNCTTAHTHRGVQLVQCVLPVQLVQGCAGLCNLCRVVQAVQGV